LPSDGVDAGLLRPFILYPEEDSDMASEKSWKNFEICLGMGEAAKEQKD
jgi:hypothetical protein